MDRQEQDKLETASVPNPYLLRLKCFLCQEPNPNINDENNNLRQPINNTTENSFNPISKLPLYTCPDCEAKIRTDDKENTNRLAKICSNLDQTPMNPETSSDEDDDDDACSCRVCSSNLNNEHDALYKKMWDHLSHVIKCLYRATDRDFSENHLADDISKAKRFVKKLTKVNSMLLFNKLETVVLEYVREIRKHVLERFYSCSKTSHDVQLFISFLLDEYQMFIQAANTVSPILLYLEENFMKSFNLTWLLYNKYLYGEIIYMDKKIHHSMTTMIDLLQPTNDDETCEHPTEADYSPCHCAQLLKRTLAFDGEMSEVACLYEDCRRKMSIKSNIPPNKTNYSTTSNSLRTKDKLCKKQGASKSSLSNNDDAQNSLPTTVAEILSSKNFSTTTTVACCEQDSNSSSVGSVAGGDESSSSSSSTDDQLLDNDTSSSGYTQEEQEELTQFIFNDDMNEYFLQEILNTVSPYSRSQNNYESTSNNNKRQRNLQNNIDIDDDWIREIIFGEIMRPITRNRRSQTDHPTEDKCTDDRDDETSREGDAETTSKKSFSSKLKSTTSSRGRKEEINVINPTTTSSSQVPRKSIDGDLLLPKSIADLTAKIQSVSFTAGTFGSITPTNSNDRPSSSSTSSTTTTAKTMTSIGQTRLSINLTRKATAKGNEHGGQKLAEALLNQFSSLNSGESSIRESITTSRKKDTQQFKKNKQQRATSNNVSTHLSNAQNLFGSTNKNDSNSSSSSAYHNLDQLLRHAASPGDLSETTLHSILSSFHTSHSTDSSSSTGTKSSISSKTTEALQALLAQQQQQHHHHHQVHQTKKSNSTNNKRCEFCCCEFTDNLSSSPSKSPTANGPVTNCVACMSLPGSTTTTTTTSVMGTAFLSAFNHRDIEMKERLKLKLTKRIVQNSAEPQSSIVDQTDQLKQQQPIKPTSNPTIKTTNKKSTKETNPKTKDVRLNDKNDIDDLVRYIDGDTGTSSNSNDHRSTPHESSSRKNKKKKDKQTKANANRPDNSNHSNQNPLNKKPVEQFDQAKSDQISILTEENERHLSTSIESRSTSTDTASVSVDKTQKSISKRKQKAKLKQQQKQEESAKKNDEKLTETKEESSTSKSNEPIGNHSSLNDVVSLPATNSSNSSQETAHPKSNVDLPSEIFDIAMEEPEEVNWITISRKQTKHKSSATVPSLLASPVLPINSTHNNKANRQTSSNTKKPMNAGKLSPVNQPKTHSCNAPTPYVTANTCSLSNSVKSSPTPTRIQTVQQNLPLHPTVKADSPTNSPVTVQSTANLWKVNPTHEHSPVMPMVNNPNGFGASNVQHSSLSVSSTNNTVPTAMFYTCPNSISPTTTTPSPFLNDDHDLSSVWNTSNVFLPMPTTLGPSSLSATLSSPTKPAYTIPAAPMRMTNPGPVQRPHTTFSPAPGPTINSSISRCIQRPSSESRSSSINSAVFPTNYQMNYSGNSVSSEWQENLRTNLEQMAWSYSQDESSQLNLFNPSNDFPLYDPFYSGAELKLESTSESAQLPFLSNVYSEEFRDYCSIQQNTEINARDTLNRQFSDSKYCFEHVPLENRERVQVNTERCFLRPVDH